MTSLAKPITSAKSASDLAEMLVTPPESKEGNLMRNKGSDIDLNALYQQSQPQSGYGMVIGMPMMNPGGQMMQQQAPNFGVPQQGNNMAGNKMFHIGSQQNTQMNGKSIIGNHIQKSKSTVFVRVEGRSYGISRGR